MQIIESVLSGKERTTLMADSHHGDNNLHEYHGIHSQIQIICRYHAISLVLAWGASADDDGDFLARMVDHLIVQSWM